jgi:hypothetical protein
VSFGCWSKVKIAPIARNSKESSCRQAKRLADTRFLLFCGKVPEGARLSSRQRTLRLGCAMGCFAIPDRGVFAGRRL